MTRHGRNLDELVYLVEMGLKPMEAIQVATLSSAKLLKLDHLIGSIQEGKLADLVVIDGDPLADIRVVQDKSKLRWVILEGEAAAGNDARARAPSGEEPR
jgi:imidazolonepropionase-like amidohydrolase